MKIPASPPPIGTLFNEIARGPGGTDRFFEIFNSGIGQQPGGRYIHWSDLLYRTPPKGFTHKEWWFAIVNARQGQMRPLPFKSNDRKRFFYATPDFVLKMLHEIDRDASGTIEIPTLIANPQTRDRYLIRSLIEEAITSSQLEGAATTHKDAKEMLREGRKPRNRSEQMIFNNFRAMQFIQRHRDDPLTPEFILEVQTVLTEDTLDDPTAAGRWRFESENVKVIDQRDGTVLHVPPPAGQINQRVKLLCEFANDAKSKPFMHPVIRAALIHFVLAYDHPFVDGNGRTARALFYWSMLEQGYWMTEFLSISSILRKAPSKYARSYLFTETDDNDVTYFLAYQLDVIVRSIQSLHDYLARKMQELTESEEAIRNSAVLREVLNHRQFALINHALKHPFALYRIAQHRKSHGITYETARKDLLRLAELSLLEKIKLGRAFAFRVPRDLNQRLTDIKTAAPHTA